MPSLDMSMTKNADFYKLVYREKRPQKVADFLLTKGFSKRSLINCRHRGGNVLVNHRRRYNNYLLHDGDEVILFWEMKNQMRHLNSLTYQLQLFKKQRII